MKTNQTDSKPVQNEYPDWVIQELKDLAQTVSPCLQCTTCASACPVFQFDNHKNPRRILYRLGNHKFDGILDEVDFWWCGNCYACTVHCPQSVSPADVLLHLKNLAFEFGKNIPKELLKTGQNLSHGFMLSIGNRIQNQRKHMGLPDLNPPDTQEIQIILKTTGFFKRMNQLLG